ncbi:MAG TPA: BatD family protein [Flavobacteriales bacterium]|nr:BatD family protein [Flavobacteriales bacterium]
MKALKYILTFLIAGLFVPAQAQSIEFQAKTSKQVVAADEAFKIQYTVNVEAPFTIPDLKDFKVLSGPSQSSMSQINIVNGQMKQTYSITYTLVIRPKKEGEFTIPPASISYNGRNYKSNTLKITVTAATGNGQADNNTNSANPVKSNGKNMFCTISVSKNSVYKGEPLQIVYKLYSRYTQIQDHNIKLGTQKDVWAQEIEGPKQGWPSYEENVGGIQYMVFPIKKEIIFPQKSGKLKLEPFDMMAVVRVNFFESSRFDLVSNSPVIDVIEPPAPPASFTNAVGKYKMESSISKEVVNVNDGIDLNLKISGTGNIRLVEPPKFEFPGDFETYDPEINDRTTVNANGMAGSKEYKYLLIPRHSGDFTIEPIYFTYFDLETKRYVTLSTPEYKIKVNKTAGVEEAGVTSNAKEETGDVDKEIRYLKSLSALTKGETYFTGSGLYYGGLALPPVAFMLLLLFLKRKEKNYDPEAEKQKQASKAVVKQLQKAHAMLQQNNRDGFYTELLSGIQIYYCDKFKVQLVDFNRSRITEVMTKNGVAQGTIALFLQVVETCEMARYANMQGNEQQTYANASAIINNIQQEVKA